MHPAICLARDFSQGRLMESSYADQHITVKIFLTNHDKLNGFRKDVTARAGFQGFFTTQDQEYAFFEWRKE